MNYRFARYILGQIAIIEALFLAIPFFIGIGYKEDTLLAYGITIGILLLIGVLLVIKKPKNTALDTKTGLSVVALAWIFMSLFGSLPFFISGHISSFIDSFFETVSGFTTTGASILSDVEAMPKSLLFWRSLTHWLGGMGVIVFIIAIMPKSETSTVHLFKAESPGPQVGKLVSKLKFNARILYGIYIALTFIELMLLLIGKMSVFDSFIHAFGTAGTGGFSSKQLGVGSYNSAYIEIVISLFMILFSINFNVYYLILIGNVKKALRSEELKVFLSIVMISIIVITTSLSLNSVYATFGDTLRSSIFQVASIISTTGYATADFSTWPLFAQMILVLLMFIGGCAGSTGGGLKVSRVIILFKSGANEIKKVLSPRRVVLLKFEDKILDATVHHGVLRYFSIYSLIFFLSLILISVGSAGTTNNFATNFSAVTSCLNNIGPGLASIGPIGNYSEFNVFAKIILSLDMLIGRLEIFPILILFYPKLWLHK